MNKRRQVRVLTFRGVDKAGVLYGLGKNSEALVCLDKILEQHPCNPEALLLKPRILGDLGRRTNALKIVEEVLKAFPVRYEALLTKALICSDAGKMSEAVRIYAELNSRRRVPKAERRYLYWYWINTLIAMKRSASAKSVLQEALSRFPEDETLNHYRTLLPHSRKPRHRLRLVGSSAIV